jgi:hypothetical protein
MIFSEDSGFNAPVEVVTVQTDETFSVWRDSNSQASNNVVVKAMRRGNTTSQEAEKQLGIFYGNTPGLKESSVNSQITSATVVPKIHLSTNNLSPFDSDIAINISTPFTSLNFTKIAAENKTPLDQSPFRTADEAPVVNLVPISVNASKNANR